MGSTGWSIQLQPIEGKTPASWHAVRDVMMQLVWDAWRVALPQPLFKTAWAWMSMGEDSLLTLGDRDQDEDAPIDEITFWFYLSVGWPSELADHWLRLALAEQRERFDSDLAELGYMLEPGSSYPKLADQRHGFILASKRIGHAGSEGVYWALPDHTYEPLADLPPGLKKRTLALAAGGACECPYCVKPGIGALDAKQAAARKKQTAARRARAKKASAAETTLPTTIMFGAEMGTAKKSTSKKASIKKSSAKKS